MMSESQLRTKMEMRRVNDLPTWLVQGEYRGLGRVGLLSAIESASETKEKKGRRFWRLPKEKVVKA